MKRAEADALDAIYRNFMFGGLAYIYAITELQDLGYTALDAERIVSEWADGGGCNWDHRSAERSDGETS